MRIPHPLVRILGATILGLVVPALSVQPATAQADGPKLFRDLIRQEDGLTIDSQPREKGPQVTFELTPTGAKPGDVVTFSVKVKLPHGGYTYATGGKFSGRTKIMVNDTPGLEPVGRDFVADRAPEVIFQKEFGHNVKKYFTGVTWSRKYRVGADSERGSLGITGKLRYQVCDDFNCTPFSVPFEVSLDAAGLSADDSGPTSTKAPFQSNERPNLGKKPGPVVVEARLSPEQAGPGDEVLLEISLAMDEGWHTYSTTQDPAAAARPTEIRVGQISGLVPLDEALRPERAFEIKKTQVIDQTYEQEIYHDRITWTQRFRVIESASAGQYGLSGSIRYQACTEQRCLRPKTVKFALGAQAQPIGDQAVGPATLNDPVEKVAPGNDGSPGSPAIAPAELQLDDAVSGGTLPLFLVFAFLGGLILNIMPCVLPVLAIKVMSFVQQAGEDRRRILALNLAYTAGVVGVFLMLATLAVTFKLAWGGLFQSSEFNLVMACIVFAMGLSLLGVFELPVPGMVGSAAGTNRQEGLSGAFLTGVFATLLATPCSGPFMGPALAWSVQQPPVVTFAIWGVMGLGMAFPYVLFGMIPSAVKLLPKPGPWMIRFKEFAGLVLMATVVFFISFLEKAYTVPLLVMLVGIALGLWMIGTLYDTTTPVRHKMAVRVSAFALTCAICLFGFGLSKPGVALPWEPFSESRLEELRAEGRHILIDFTADWCLICKKNEKFALNTEETLDLVEKHNVVPLYADYTHDSPEIERWLGRFESVSVPLTVIFPAGRPNQPIIIRDHYTQSTLLEKLQEAVDEEAASQVQASSPNLLLN
jgi:thiol:disulfide interchange protein